MVTDFKNDDMKNCKVNRIIWESYESTRNGWINVHHNCLIILNSM